MPDVNPEDEQAADTTTTTETTTNPATVTEEGEEAPAEQKSFSLSSIFFQIKKLSSPSPDED